MHPWAGRFRCISCQGSFGISMGWLVCVFQCTVCVWIFCGDSVDGWLWVFQLSGWHTCIYFCIKGLLIMYTWHLNQQFLRILTLHFHNKMRLNVNLHFVTLFMLLIHCVARYNEYRYGTCSCLLSWTKPLPPPHPVIISPSYIKHTGFTKNVSVQNLNKYVFPDSLDKIMHNDTN